MSTNRGKRKASLVEIANTHMAKSCVFLAYANADAERVMELYQQLKDYGLDPWMDKYDLLPGQQWEEEIERAIHSSDFFLACLSERSSDANYLSKELRIALGVYEQMPPGRIYFIPVRLDDTELPDLSVGTIRLRDFQWVDLADPEGFGRLLRVLSPKQSLVDIGNDFFFKAAYDLAIDAYRKALRRNSQDASAWYYLGRVYLEGKNDLRRAQVAFRKAVEIQPDLHEAWYYLGCAYERTDSPWHPSIYHQTNPRLVQRAVDLANATQADGLIALCAATGSTFYKLFREPLLNALERGVSVQIMLCHIRNRTALEARSRRLVRDNSMVEVLQQQLQDSAHIIDEIAQEADNLPGTLAVRAYGNPIRIYCARTIILPHPNQGKEEPRVGKSLADGVLFHVPYTDKLGRDSIVYEFPATTLDLEGEQPSPFLHYYHEYYAVWNHPSTAMTDVRAWYTTFDFRL